MRRGIKTKLSLNLVITMFIILVIFVIFLNKYLKDYSKDELEKTIFFLGENACLSLQVPLFNHDYNRLKSIIQPVVIDDFDYFIVYDNLTHNIAFKDDKKKILTSFKYSEVLNKKLNFEKSIMDLNGNKYNQYLFPITIPQVSEPLGFLIIGVSEEKMQSRLIGITYWLIVLSVLLFLILTLTIFFLSGKITKPIKKLSTMVEKLAGGDYSVRSDIETDDEIGALSKDFNIMADKINEQIVSIAKYSKNLEEMVKERSGELREALDNIKEKEEKLNQEKKINSLNSLVTSIAHEINNPMAIISGNIQMIESNVKEESIEKKRFKVVQDAIKRIETLINDINFLSTIKDVTIFQFSFSNLLNRIVKDLVPESIKISIEGCEENYINSNQNLVSICIENILQNSVDIIKHRNIDGKISIRYFMEDSFFIVEITDNGGGIEDPDNIFEPFYSTYSNKKGLGLTFVFHAVQALNGSIVVGNIQNGAKITIKMLKLSPNI